MATVNINSQPSRITAGENPIILDLGTAASGSTESYPLTTITVNNGVTAGVDYVQFTFIFPALQGIRFNSSASPTAANEFLSSGYTFIFTPTTFTNAQIAESLAESLRTQSLVSTYYSVWVSSNVIYIKAKIPNQRFALATTTVAAGGNNILTTSNYSRLAVNVLNIGAAKWQGDLQSKYSMWVDLFIDDNNQKVFNTDAPISGMTYITTLKKAWQYGNNNVNFDLAPTLKPYTEFPSSTYGTGFEGKFDKWIRNYKLQYGDYDTIGLQSIAVILSGYPNTLKSLKGTISDRWVTPVSLDYTSGNTLATYYSGYTAGAGYALTNSPVNKPVAIAQDVEYVYWINKYQTTFTGNTYTLIVDIDYEYIDGTVGVGSNVIVGGYTGSTTVNGNGLWRVNVAPQQVGIDSLGMNSGKLVRGYTVDILAGTSPTFVSQIQPTSYSIEEIQPRTGVELMWLNEFGTHDNFYFGGNIVTSVERDLEDMIKNVPYDYPEGFEYNSQYDTQVTDVLTISSSFVSEDVFNWLKSILKSNKVYWMKNQRAEFVKITEFEYEKDTITNKYSVQLTLIRTIADHNVSV